MSDDVRKREVAEDREGLKRRTLKRFAYIRSFPIGEQLEIGRQRVREIKESRK